MITAKHAHPAGSTFLLISLAVSLAALFAFFLYNYQHSTLPQSFFSLLWVVVASAFLALLLTTSFFYLKGSRIFAQPRSKANIDQLVADNILFHHLSEKSGDMILICDGNCKILYANPVTSKLIGHTLATILNADAMDFIHPVDRGPIKEDMISIKQGKSVPAREIHLLRNNRDVLNVEVKGFSLQTGKNGSGYLGAILRDISSRKKNEQLLQVQEDWEQTFNTMTELVSVHDSNFIVIKANRALCKFLGKSPEEILGKPCYQVFHDTKEPYPGCPHQRATKTGSVVTEIVDDPAIGIPITVTCSPLFDANGNIQGSVHIGRVADEAIASEKTTKDILPICASCKDIRYKGDKWMSIEMFFTQQYGVRFTHGICQNCQKKLYPDFIQSQPLP